MKALKIKVGKLHTLPELQSCLNAMGYTRDAEVRSGTYRIDGGNLTIFAVNFTDPIRVEFFGQEIERISKIDKWSFHSIKKIDRAEVIANQINLSDGSKIHPGEFIVHEDHGIGYFSHIETKIVSGFEEVYYAVNYQKEDRLYVPCLMKQKLFRYVGVGKRKPKLSKLGSKVWEKTYKKTYENVLRLAKELLELYAAREISKRKPFKIDLSWDQELKMTFCYKETPDQERAVAQVYSDLQKNIPMDRLICGDVGFGKTEVAIRAAAQTIANGFQVALLVPTTILAEQHHVTLFPRFKNLPVKIKRISRLVGQKEQAETIKEAFNGSLDLLIGTHKLFSQNLKFKRLGLLIIDEEQKFGVKQKEKLKKLKSDLNVLTMTATPIPRTFFMALSGIRDISEINSPPLGRKEIKTEVAQFDNDKIKYYLERELGRKGQVYYLHNRVPTIGPVVKRITKLMPKSSVAFAHGQMGEIELAKTMREFALGKIDILVCSTIIENGLDLPNVNTLIVEDSDKLGLSQMYQIRGRIGRSGKQAHALFMVREKGVSVNAFKRLKTLVENVELGSGYNIAWADLEIRGGGNILGREQHGNMEAVGLVLYSKLLSQAVLKLKNNKIVAIGHT